MAAAYLPDAPHAGIFVYIISHIVAWDGIGVFCRIYNIEKKAGQKYHFGDGVAFNVMPQPKGAEKTHFLQLLFYAFIYRFVTNIKNTFLFFVGVI